MRWGCRSSRGTRQTLTTARSCRLIFAGIRRVRCGRQQFWSRLRPWTGWRCWTPTPHAHRTGWRARCQPRRRSSRDMSRACTGPRPRIPDRALRSRSGRTEWRQCQVELWLGERVSITDQFARSSADTRVDLIAEEIAQRFTEIRCLEGESASSYRDHPNPMHGTKSYMPFDS